MCLFISAHFNHNQALYNRKLDEKELLSPKLHKFAANHEGKRRFPLISDVLVEHVARLTH